MQTNEQIQLVVNNLFSNWLLVICCMPKYYLHHYKIHKRGMKPYEAVAAAEQGTAKTIKEKGIEARLILCTLRHFTETQSMKTVQLVKQFKGAYVAGFDTAADEAGFPVDNHFAVFKYPKQHTIFCTAHASKAKGAESVWETLQYFKPSRIGHGVRSIEDKKLVEHLCKNNIHLEICPTYNEQINIYHNYEDHPITELNKAGVSFNINKNTRTITNTNLNKKYEKLQEVFGWTITDFYNCIVNALQAAFIPDELRETLLKKLYKAFKDIT